MNKRINFQNVNPFDPKVKRDKLVLIKYSIIIIFPSMKIWNKVFIVTQAGCRVFIELLIFPFRKNRTDFSSQLKKATRILIACSLDSEDSSCEKEIVQIARLFPSEGVVILHPNPKRIVKKTLTQWTMEYSDNKYLHFWQLMTSTTHQKIKMKSFELFIDLNPKPCLYTYYLCCLQSSALRISFSKTGSSKFYNFIFRSDSELPYSRKLVNLFHLLKSLR